MLTLLGNAQGKEGREMIATLITSTRVAITLVTLISAFFASDVQYLSEGISLHV